MTQETCGQWTVYIVGLVWDIKVCTEIQWLDVKSWWKSATSQLRWVSLPLAASARWGSWPSMNLIGNKWGFGALSLGAVDQDRRSGLSWSLVGFRCFAESIGSSRGRIRELCSRYSGVKSGSSPLRTAQQTPACLSTGRMEQGKRWPKLSPGSCFGLSLQKVLAWALGWPSLWHERRMWRYVD